ncbi:hypothetical protein RRF68_06795 [Tenacibaculum sp. HL-MS23]|uniref:hypothetical protein n=1 Tax=Tenacibaculum sp. HL-MS23 TaxID=3077734 RepID=UPI0028FC2F7C|nr:hypothetical protein [Tenacibaculum sp. HL-MS23]WNW00713.1 hypothetical protein RRF68_06795 [Tenacibaculum sp. HL-MS23]
MGLEKLEDKLNKNINEETELIHKVSLIKYVLIYVPVLFLMFAITNFIASLLFEGIAFDWRRILIQAFVFGFFFRIFHAVRKGWNNAWENK